MPLTAADILLIEDNPAHIDLTKEAFKETKIVKGIHVAMDGQEAMDYLHQKGKFSNAKRPDLILLDLNLPKKDGRQVLAEIKNDSELRRIPVIVLTTSEADRDIIKSYDLHANSYICKPVQWKNFVEVIKGIEKYWFSITTLAPTTV